MGVDATDDGKLERGLGFGDFERFSREASLCALSWAEWIALSLTSSSPMIPGELAREWTVSPMASVGTLEPASVRGGSLEVVSTLSAYGMLAVGNGR